MKTLTIALFGLAALVGPNSGLQGLAAAQGPGELIAHDYCQRYDWDQEILCGVFLSNGAYIGDGIEPAWSPDGSRIAFGGYSQPGIFVMNLADWSAAQLTVYGESPTWSPDGLKLAFAAGELYVMGVDGSSVVRLTQNIGFIGQPDWSPDGQTIAFDCEIDVGNRDICTVHADGTGLVRLTTNPGWDSGPAFSPDGSRIAFVSAIGTVIMNADGTGSQAYPAGFDPAWSPDGTQIAYVEPFWGGCDADGRICPDTIYITSIVDGSGPTAVTSGNHPAWALSARPVASFFSRGCDDLACVFDGTGSWGGDGGIVSYTWQFGDGTTGSGPEPAHTYAATGTFAVTLTVTDAAGVTGIQTASVPVVVNQRPTASFTYDCYGSQCNFNGLGSGDVDGAIARYDWYFGDGNGATVSSVNHRYAAAGAFTVTLMVTDNGGATDRQQQTVTITAVTNTAPVASFTFACSELTCTFNASGSSDPDGNIVSHVWNFGDGTAGSGATPSRTYAAAGTYTVTLTVTDNSGATSTHAQGVTAVAPPMHVGDLDRASTSQQNRWTAIVTITVHDMGHGPVAGTAISGSWNNGISGSCTTNASGQCAVSRSGIAKNTNSTSFTVTGAARSPFTYIAGGNHDPDADSNGSTIAVTRP